MTTRTVRVKQVLNIAGCTVAFDRDATVAAYAKILVAGPERSGCWYCRNWSAARDSALPRELLDVLARLGVPVQGETEVWEAPLEDRRHLYCGWYLFVGSVVQQSTENEEVADRRWQMWISQGRSFEVRVFAGLEVVELNFSVEGVGDFIERDSPAGQ